MQLEKLKTLPTRRFLSPGQPPSLDDHGFLQAEDADSSFTIDMLLGNNASLIIAPPWTGKTFVAKQLAGHFAAESDGNGHKSFFTGFETFAVGSSFTPTWWDAWASDSRRGPAYWIIDALDEDERRQANCAHTILDQIGNLDLSRLSKLHLILFCRENEIPDWIENQLQTIYGRFSQVSFARARLAALDVQSAQELLEDVGATKEDFREVCQLIQDKHLQLIAGLPSVLEWLYRNRKAGDLTDTSVWQGVLSQLLLEKRDRTRNDDTRTINNAAFHCAARVAAIVSLSGIPSFDCDRNTSVSFPQIKQFIPMGHRGQSFVTAWPVVRKSAVLYDSQNGFCFSQDHVQQWFAAFGLSDLPLLRLRPLISDDYGEIQAHLKGFIPLLCKTTKHSEVRIWCERAMGGFIGPSDAAPWTLGEALNKLDQLQQLCRNSSWGLSLNRDELASTFNVHGLGSHLAERLLDKRLFEAERMLLLDIGFRVKPPELKDALILVMKDNLEDYRVRSRASSLFGAMAPPQELMQIAEEVIPSYRDDTNLHSAASSLILKLVESRLWDNVRAINNAPPLLDNRTVGFTSLLYSKLEETLALPDARQLLRDANLKDLIHMLSKEDSHYCLCGFPKLWLKSIDLVCRQDVLSLADFELLRPIIKAPNNISDAWHWPMQLLVATFLKSVDARRSLFVEVLDLLPDAISYCPLRLPVEDLEWLLEFATTKKVQNQWLWNYLLTTSDAESVSAALQKQIRDSAEAAHPGIVVIHDEHRAAALLNQRQLEEKLKQTRERMSPKHPNYELAELVEDILWQNSLDLHGSMLNLTRLCFVEQLMRPTNVKGKWEGLPLETQSRVLELCAKALRQCHPTPIPNENSYPMSVIYESYCFATVVEHNVKAYTLDGHQIEAWLPSAMIFSLPSRESLLITCAATDREAFESVVVREARRELALPNSAAIAVSNLPKTLWMDSLAVKLIQLVGEERLPMVARMKLMDVVTWNSPIQAGVYVRTQYDRYEAVNSAGDFPTALLDILLALYPVTAWREVKRRLGSSSENATLAEFHSLIDMGEGVRANFSQWPSHQLKELMLLILKYFPRSAEVEMSSGTVMVGADYRWRELRDRIPVLLEKREFENGEVEAGAALAELAKCDPVVENFIRSRKANRDADEVLKGHPNRSSTSQTSARVSIEQVTRALDYEEYRLIRNGDDLQQVLVEAIESLGRTAHEHLSMLYTSRKSPKPQEHLDEDALQTYIFCRLNDRLPDRVLDHETTVTFINREALATKDQRLDIKVEAPTTSKGRASVVIEIKWSSNREVSTSMFDQLGGAYLREEGPLHGIYLVGWCGDAKKWKDNACEAPKSRTSLLDWRDAFIRQATMFNETKKPKRIVPIVMDLFWPQSGGRTRPARNRKRS